MTPTKELSEIIAKAIYDEPFLKKETLVPKITSLIKGFRVQLEITNFNKIEKPSTQAKLMKSLRVKEKELNYWKNIVRQTIGEDKMMSHYKYIEELRK